MAYYRIDPLNPFPPTFAFPSNQYWGPWEIAGAQYIGTLSAGIFTIYKSVNGGVTWVSQDDANRPNTLFSFQDSSAVAGPGGVIHIAYTNSFTTMAATTFDTATDTFSGVVTLNLTIAGGGNLSNCFLALLSNGNYRVLFLQADPGDAFRDHSWWAEWNGAAWTVPVQVDTNLTGLFESQFNQFLHGTGDVLHLWWQNDVGPRDLYYRQLSAAGALGPISTLIVGYASTIVIGHPSIWTGNVVLPYQRQVGPFDRRAAVLIGTPEAIPVWASTDLDINPLCVQLYTYPYAAGASIRVYYLIEDNATVHQIWYTDNTGSGWSASTLLFDEASDPVLPPPLFQFVHNVSFALLSTGTWSGFFGLEVASDGGQLCTIFAMQQGGVPPTPSTSRVVTGTRRMVVLVPNYWDHCLWKEPPAHRKIPSLSDCCGVNPRLEYFNRVEMPDGAIPFYRTAGIATPLAATGDVLIFAYEVPVGYDGIIRGLFHHYTGPGFLEGSGDLEWRLKVNRVYAQYLGDVLVSLGSIGEPMPLEDGIPLTSQQRVEYIVNAPNLSGGILPVDSRIVAGIVGWLVVRR